MTIANTSLMPGTLRVSYHTAQGPRPSNEDWLGGYVPADPRWQIAKGGCFVVADGFGGHHGGEVASRIAGETVLTTYFRAPITDLATELGTALLAANQGVNHVADRYRELRGMATTIVAVAMRGAEAVVAHMGDSRAYLLRQHTLFSLTKDHTWVQSLVDGRIISPAEAAAHPYRHIVTRYAGMGPGGSPDVRRVHLQPGDTLLLCSDGLSDRVPSSDLRALINGPQVQDPAARLTHRALRLGTRDNASALVLRYLPGRMHPSPVAPAALSRRPAQSQTDLLPALIFGGALAVGASALALLLAALV